MPSIRSITKYPYPKAGQQNAAVRIGVVEAAGGPTRWIEAPGDPRNIYIPRMAWAENSREVIFQHLNRLQNTKQRLPGRRRDGEIAVDASRTKTKPGWMSTIEFIWLEKGKALLFVSERDGWRHAYAVSRDGQTRLITTRALRPDLHRRNRRGGRLAILQRLAGKRHPAVSLSLAPRREQDRAGDAGRDPGSHTYNLSPDCRWAFHGYSAFAVPNISEMIRLPDHKAVRRFHR